MYQFQHITIGKLEDLLERCKEDGFDPNGIVDVTSRITSNESNCLDYRDGKFLALELVLLTDPRAKCYIGKSVLSSSGRPSWILYRILG